MCGCPESDPSKPPDYNLFWTFANNSGNVVTMAGGDAVADLSDCQDGHKCKAGTPNVVLNPGESAASQSYGPGDIMTTQADADVVNLGQIVAHQALLGVPVTAGQITSLTATWDGTQLTINLRH